MVPNGTAHTYNIFFVLCVSLVIVLCSGLWVVGCGTYFSRTGYVGIEALGVLCSN